MNRNYVNRAFKQLSHNDLNRKTAIYEAGHAAAICLGNKQRQLPPIFFQISITGSLSEMSAEWIAKMEGGRLIHTLPSSFEEATKDFSPVQKQAYQVAFEADIVNLLVGPLSVAKHVAMRNAEPINLALIPFHALHYYGGATDLQIIREYLECFITEKADWGNKIAELLLSALNFINNPSHWRAIIALSDYILRTGKDKIDCEEAGLVITQQAY